MKIKPRYVKSSVAVEEPLRPSAALNKVNLRFRCIFLKPKFRQLHALFRFRRRFEPVTYPITGYNMSHSSASSTLTHGYEISDNLHKVVFLWRLKANNSMWQKVELLLKTKREN